RSRQLRPLPEERPQGASRRMATRSVRSSFETHRGACHRAGLRPDPLAMFPSMRPVLAAGSASGGGLAVLVQQAMAELRDRLERHLRRLTMRDVLDARDQQHIDRAVALLPRD